MARGANGTSKAQAVRDYLTKNPNAANKDVAEATGASPQQVSNLRSKMGGSGRVAGSATKAKAGRKAGKPAARLATKQGSASVDQATLIAVKKFVSANGGAETVRAAIDTIEALTAE